MKKIIFSVLALSLIAVSSYCQEEVTTPNELSEWWEKFEEQFPDVATSWNELNDAIFQEGKLSIKEKHFIGLGIAVSMRCEPCITFHIAGAMESGATEEEMMEAASVAIFMGGGPALTEMRLVNTALEALSNMKEGENAEK
jgi:AhpD family alkylhydroperoxidase